MPVIRIDRVDDPRLDDYRNVPDAELLRRRHLFVAEGRLVVQRLLASPYTVMSLLLNESSLKSLELDLTSRLEGVPVFVGSAADLAEIAGFNIHRGCLALAKRPADRTTDEIVKGATTLLALEGVTDADNVGGAFRNAAAFGVNGVLLCSCCDPLYRKAVRTSMANVLRVPYARMTDWPGGLSSVRAAGFTLVALTPRPHAADIGDFVARRPRPARIALLVGGESLGLSAAAESLADVCVRIPMHGDVDSLNLATASGIALHRLTS